MTDPAPVINAQPPPPPGTAAADNYWYQAQVDTRYDEHRGKWMRDIKDFFDPESPDPSHMTIIFAGINLAFVLGRALKIFLDSRKTVLRTGDYVFMICIDVLLYGFFVVLLPKIGFLIIVIYLLLSVLRKSVSEPRVESNVFKILI